MLIPIPTNREGCADPLRPSMHLICCLPPNPLPQQFHSISQSYRYMNKIESIPIIDGHRLVRKMRGGAQAHLIKSEDGRNYVTKVLNNPQGRRTLVNEVISFYLLRMLGIETPDIAFIRLTCQFLRENVDVYLELQERRSGIEPGLHFGSYYLTSPSTIVDNRIPVVLSRVLNSSSFVGIFVFDKWVANLDSRQIIFHKQPGGKAAGSLAAAMIDQGYTFGGCEWTFHDSPISGFYFRSAVYANKGKHSCQPWIDKIRAIPTGSFWAMEQAIPDEWLLGNERRLLQSLLCALDFRRGILERLIEESIWPPRDV
jgi:hypothetical protein